VLFGGPNDVKARRQAGRLAQLKDLHRRIAPLSRQGVRLLQNPPHEPQKWFVDYQQVTQIEVQGFKARTCSGNSHPVRRPDNFNMAVGSGGDADVLGREAELDGAVRILGKVHRVLAGKDFGFGESEVVRGLVLVCVLDSSFSELEIEIRVMG
jgi:hypothetical protein